MLKAPEYGTAHGARGPRSVFAKSLKSLRARCPRQVRLVVCKPLKSLRSAARAVSPIYYVYTGAPSVERRPRLQGSHLQTINPIQAFISLAENLSGTLLLVLWVIVAVGERGSSSPRDGKTSVWIAENVWKHYDRQGSSLTNTFNILISLNNLTRVASLLHAGKGGHDGR